MIHTDFLGEGETVVFVHADFVDGRMWDEVCTTLAPRYRTVAYDKLGYGRSDPATGPVARRAELSGVVDAAGPGPVHLVGCSNGGLTALDYTLDNPGRVLTLTLVNASPSGWQPEGSPPPLLLAMIEATQRGDLALASELQLQIWFDGPQRTPTSPSLNRAREKAGLMNRTFVDRGTFFVAGGSSDPLDRPARGRLSEVAVPTLVIDGRWDWSENRRASQILAEGIPGALRIEVDGAHVWPLEDAGGFTQLWEKIVQVHRPAIRNDPSRDRLR
jgi:pimeloyl-ACP methyl ester carboxylesterase